jgi:hypothetical protein
MLLLLNQLVPETGVEPAHVAIPDPKSGASANFATPARKRDGKTPLAETMLQLVGH